MIENVYRVCALMLPIALEGLPASSSGHVLLCAAMIQYFFGVSVAGTLPRELDHVLHLPIAIVVALFFLPRWWYLLARVTRVWFMIFKIVCLGFITLSATAILYFLFGAIGTDWFPLWAGFACTAALLFSLRYVPSNFIGSWSIYTAPLLGAAQGLALLPGISRLGITYTTARWLGMRPQKAFELSFLIEWPVSVAGFLKGIVDMHTSGSTLQLTSCDSIMLVCAIVFGYLGLWLMQYLVTNRSEWIVGWYVACLAVVTFLSGV
jgi:undecaprenyl-diphosphatase